tara:strand:+ start:194 stop:742 length:549 start_codon:yes stop_codon:yes gene_type:complete
MITGDSGEYHLLKQWAQDFDCDGYKTVEIGVRRGMASKIIMDNCKNYYMHVGIDPYNNLKYQHYDGGFPRTKDYTNEMRDQLLKDFEPYKGKFNLANMTDCEFMMSDASESTYAFVHFDGPHRSKDVLTQAIWFANRSAPCTRFIFDDFTEYQMDIIAYALTIFNFKTIQTGEKRICLQKDQ